METITLDFTIEEVNCVLASLGKMPFAHVAPLVDKIRQQAAPQVKAIQEKNAQAQATAVAS